MASEAGKQKMPMSILSKMEQSLNSVPWNSKNVAKEANTEWDIFDKPLSYLLVHGDSNSIVEQRLTKNDVVQLQWIMYWSTMATMVMSVTKMIEPKMTQSEHHGEWVKVKCGSDVDKPTMKCYEFGLKRECGEEEYLTPTGEMNLWRKTEMRMMEAKFSVVNKSQRRRRRTCVWTSVAASA